MEPNETLIIRNRIRNGVRVLTVLAVGIQQFAAGLNGVAAGVVMGLVIASVVIMREPDPIN